MFRQTQFQASLLLALLTFLLAGRALAGLAPENVAVVVNGDSDASRTIAEEYVRLRGIPAGNLVTITGLSDQERISIEEFRQRILGPVLQALRERGLTPQIDVIAYSAAIPTAIDVSADIGQRQLPQVFTPTASINGLTFLHETVRAGDVRYLDLNINLYARRVLTDTSDTAWTVDEQRQLADVMMQLQKWIAAKQNQKDSRPVPEEEQTQIKSQLSEILTTLEALQKAHPHASHLHYNRACCLAQLDQSDAAITALNEAMKSGWWDHRHAARDEDFKSLRGRDEFKAILEQMKAVDVSVQPARGFRSSLGWLSDGSHSTDERGSRYLLSTVLACTTGRGMSVDEALTQLRRTAAADGTRPRGTVYFERNGDVRSTTREWAFRSAARQLEALGVQAIVEEGVLPQNRSDVAGAVIGIADFQWSGSGSTILPGAIVEHLTSFGGVMTSGAGQTPLTEFLKQGAAGASGTVTEPYAIQAKFPSPWIHVHYASGCTLAEAFYQSVTGPYQLLIVGDPLAQPWRRQFSLQVDLPGSDQPLSGEILLPLQTSSADGIRAAEWELYVDGLRVFTGNAAEPVKWDSRKHANGPHAMTLVARGDDAVQTLARSTFMVTIANGP